MDWSVIGAGAAAALSGFVGWMLARPQKKHEEEREVMVERRNDHTVEFAENAYKAIIHDYAAQVALKNAELLNKDLEIARLRLLADKDDERKDNMVRRHYTGKDILQTDVGLPK